MGIASFEAEIKMNFTDEEELEYQRYLNFLEQESWIDRMIEEEKEAIELERHLILLDVRGEKI